MSTATTVLPMSLEKTTQNVKQTEEKETFLGGDFEYIELDDGIEDLGGEFEIIELEDGIGDLGGEDGIGYLGGEFEHISMAGFKPKQPKS